MNVLLRETSKRITLSFTRSFYFDELLHHLDSKKGTSNKIKIMKDDFDKYTMKRVKGCGNTTHFRELKAVYIKHIKDHALVQGFLTLTIRHAIKYNNYPFFKDLLDILIYADKLKPSYDIYRHGILTRKHIPITTAVVSVQNALSFIAEGHYNSLTNDTSIYQSEKLIRLVENTEVYLAYTQSHEPKRLVIHTLPFLSIYTIISNTEKVKLVWYVLRMAYGIVDYSKDLGLDYNFHDLSGYYGRVWFRLVPFFIISRLVDLERFDLIDRLAIDGKIANRQYLMGYAFKYDRPLILAYVLDSHSTAFSPSKLVTKAYFCRTHRIMEYLLNVRFFGKPYEDILPRLRNKQWRKLLGFITRNKYNYNMVCRTEGLLYDFLRNYHNAKFISITNLRPRCKTVKSKNDDYVSIIPQ